MSSILQLVHVSRFALIFCLSGFWFSTCLGQTTKGANHLKDIIYTKHDGVALTLDVIQPANPNGCGVISIVSGGWVSSHDRIGSGEPFVNRGYTVFYIVHGSQPRFTVEEIIADINRAVRFIRYHAKEYGVDPMKLGITGSSAGGHLSLMIATRGKAGELASKDSVDHESSAVQAVAVFYPPTDYLNWSAVGDTAVGIGKLAAYAGAFGPGAALPGGRLKIGTNVSPIYGVTKLQPPIYIIHGDSDRSVPIFQAYRFKKRCDEEGAICEIKVVPGAGHGGWKGMTGDTELLADWFDKYLRGMKKN